MKTRIYLNQALKKWAVGFLSVLAILAIAFPVTGGAYAQEPVPWLIAFPENDAVEGWEWPEGATVYLTINNAPEGFIREGTAEVTSWGDPRTYIRFDFAGEGGYDLQVGDLVTLTDQFGTTATHTVQNLAIAKVNQEDDIVKGTADPGTEIHVWPYATGQEQVAITNPKGKWNVDFTGIYDLKFREGGRAEVRDGFGNATAVDWYIPQPRFTIFPDAQWFDGIDWPDGATVTIAVKNKPECTFTRESWGGFFNGGFPEGCIVTAGDKVTFSDGTITQKHTIQNLAITKIDKEANTVMGNADTGAVVHAWVWSSEGYNLEGSDLEVTAVNGGWLADFGALGIDLEVGLGIQAEITDETGNATSVDLNVPDTRIVASISEDWIYLVDFLPGKTLDISIYDRMNAEDPIWHSNEIMTDVNGLAWIDSEGWDLKPGNYLVVSDENTLKDLVIEDFTFDVFNLSNGQLIGTAPEPYGRNVWVGIGWENDGWSMDVTTGGTGVWIADFGQPVPSDYQWVAAQIFDDDGDASELRPSAVIDLAIANQPDWVNSGIYVRAGQSFTIEALGSMNPCSDTYPNGDVICIFYTPLGAEWEVPYENQFGIFPGPGLSFMALLGRIGDGDPFYVGAGGTFTAEQDGTLWFTPNDNLRTDNQGAYSVRVLLEP